MNKSNLNLFKNSNLFFKSNDFMIYYKTLFKNFNDNLINKVIDKKEIEVKGNLINKAIDKEEIELEGLELNYKRNIFFYNFNNNKDFFINKKIKSSNYDSTFFCKDFTLLEFILYLLKKINYKFNDKFFNKILKLKSLISFLRLFKYLNFKINKNYNFLLFYLVVLLKSMIFSIKKNRKYKIRDKVYFILYELLGYNFFFIHLKIIKNFLTNIFFIVNKVKNICYKFYFLSNKNITARWLSRYIGIKLKNNYSFYSVLNPVKRELYKLCKSRWNKGSKYIKINKLSNLIKTNNKKYKYNFKNLIKNFFLIYIKENYFYYISNNIYIYDLYIYFKNKKSKLNKLKLSKFINLYKYLYINIFINYYWELNLIKKQKIVDNIVSKVHNYVLGHINNKFNFDIKKFYISAFFMKNLLNFNYFKYIWLEIKKINARNIRSSNVKRNKSILVGYKLAFKGRFSRKQRASNIWLMHGTMSLNTLALKLDYSFFTIPLKNSAISIKVILYKNLYNENFKYLLIY